VIAHSDQRQQTAFSVSNQRHPDLDAYARPIVPPGVVSMVASEWFNEHE
jgi:hypothetical protein